MLATREDNEAVAAIEKLTGTKISRAETAGPETAPVEPKRAEKRAERPEKRAERPKRAEQPARKDREEFREPSPIVEDIKADWNGPLPSFLSVGAL
jgi:hypothetical protein